MGKIKKKFTEVEKKSFLVEQDLRIVKALSGNDKQIRDKVLKYLRKWLGQRSAKLPLTEEDLLRLWKGLFYTIWMSDKSLVQEECAENIAKLIHFASPDSSMLFFKCGLMVLAAEWFGIDQLRLDKFLMFVRRLFRQTFVALKKSDWNLELVKEFGDILVATVLKKDNSNHLGLTMHVMEIYLEELAKVSLGKIGKNAVAEFVKPFVIQLSTLQDVRLIAHMRKFLFGHLLEQSDEGIEFQVKFEAWKSRGFPGGSIDFMHKVEKANDEADSDEDEIAADEPLDPRAGCIDVALPQLKFDASQISQLLLDHKFAKGSTTKTREVISKMAENFNKLSKGIYPLGMKQIPVIEDDGYKTKLKQSVNRLVKFEKKLMSDSSKNCKRKLKSNSVENAKKVKIDDESADLDTSEFFADKLQDFIARSEGGLPNGVKAKKIKSSKTKVTSKTKLKKRSKSDAPDYEYESHFERNSGTWQVDLFDSTTDLDLSKMSDLSDSPASPEPEEEPTPLINGDSVENHTEIEEQKKVNETNMNETVQTKDTLSLFVQSEWDLPPKEGETEFFVPANKYKKKMQKIRKKSGKEISEILENSLNKISKCRLSLNSGAKSEKTPIQRFSLDSYVVKKPFTKLDGSRKKVKKVKIALKLNQSQEIHEHHAQLQSSPLIPFDANKKPLKPLLKPNAVGSPINPFYKRKLNQKLL